MVLEPSATATVSGIVTDGETGVPVTAVITVPGTPVDPVETDAATGAYEITLPLGEYTLCARAGGYFPRDVSIDVQDDAAADFPLRPFDISVLLVDDRNNHDYDSLTAYEEALQELGIGSQEYLRRRSRNAFNGLYLGVADFTDDSGSSRIAGVGGHPVGRHYPGPFELAFSPEISNLTDTVVAAEHVGTAFIGDIAARGIALTVDGLYYKTAFLAFPWEVIGDDGARIDIMHDFLAWLADKPETGFITGTVTDHSDGGAVAAAAVRAMVDGETVRRTTTDEDGHYSLRVPLGTFTVDASAPHYEAAEAEGVIVREEGDEVFAHFSLETGLAATDKGNFEFTLFEGDSASDRLVLANEGTVALTWEIEGHTFRPQHGESENIRLVRDPAYDVLSPTAEGLYGDARPEYAPAEPGEVIRSWPTGLAIPWGVGYDGDVIISNPAAGGGDDHNHRFTVEGSFLSKWSTSPWRGSWAADMTYDEIHHLIWQVNVGGDNCLYGLDPEDGSRREKICGSPWTDESQLGVAYRSDNDTLYIGGWDEDIIYHCPTTAPARLSNNTKTSPRAASPA